MKPNGKGFRALVGGKGLWPPRPMARVRKPFGTRGGGWWGGSLEDDLKPACSMQGAKVYSQPGDGGGDPGGGSPEAGTAVRGWNSRGRWARRSDFEIQQPVWMGAWLRSRWRRGRSGGAAGAAIGLGE